MYDETAPRSIFATTWFRALLVLIVLAVAVAVTAPYILEATRPSSKPTTAARPTPPPAAATPSPPPPASSAMSTQPDKPATPDTAPADKPAATPMPPRKPLAGDKTALADKSDKAATTAKSAAADKAAATDKKDAPATKTAAVLSTTTASAPRAATGGWWVQVGAFRDENKAHNLAAKLREDNYTVEQSFRSTASRVTKSAASDKSPAASTSGPAGADQYDVFVSGLSAEELNTRLGAKGLAAEPSGAGALIKPSLPLREAVALSKDLAMEGLKVQVRRAAGASAPAPRAAEKRPAPVVRGGDALYRVRVGAFPDKATAMTTLKELEAKGYKPFISRGGP